jgi:hypothetical protein
MVGLYLAHLIETHWEYLQLLRDGVGSTRVGHDAWQRL